MVSETYESVMQLIKSLHHGNYIDAMTEKWLSCTQNLPSSPVFYTLTKIHKPNSVGRTIIFELLKPCRKNIIFCISFSLSLKRIRPW